MLPKPAIEERQQNAKCHTCNIGNPILHIRAVSKGRLYNFYETAKGTCANKDWDEPNAACTRKWKGQSGKGNNVHNFVSAIRRWGRLIDWPKHGHCQNSCDNQCERDIEILAHVNRLKALGAEHKEKL